MWFTKLTRHQFWSRLRWCRGLGEKCSRKSCLFLRACPRLWCPGTWSTGSGAGGWPKPRHPRPQRPGHTSEKIFQTDPPVKEQTFSQKNWRISFFWANRNLPLHQEICPNILLWTILGAEHRPIESFWWHRALSAFSHVLILKYSHYSCISLKFFKFWMLLFLKNNLLRIVFNLLR